MNIIIGVGGTGAKVVESVLHFAAMGVGPNSLRVGFVDQDRSNGNLNRALQVFESYRSTRAAWRGDDAVHRLGGAEECPLFKTDIEPLGEQDGLWIPDDGAGTTLASVFGPMGEDQYLFDALFHTGDDKTAEEQQLTLDDGFQGRPHIGAAVITDRAEQRSAFWDSVTETIKSAGSGGAVRILLAGSVFGGTGAAGFPTIARLIRNRLKDEGITRGVDIGGILMLPYFGYPNPNEDQDQNVALADEQLMQSRGALRHYEDMLGGEHIFDQLYMVGWNPLIRLEYHEKGSGDQRNPALLPEFVAGSAASRFFLSERLPEEEGLQAIMVSARRDKNQFGWPDVPALTSGSGEMQRVLHEYVARFLRFAVAFKYWKPQIGNSQERREMKRSEEWYVAQGLDDVDWDEASPSQALNYMEASIDHALRWFAAMETYARHDQDVKFELWHIAKALVDPIDEKRPNKDPSVKDRLDDQDYRRSYESIAGKYAASDDSMSHIGELADNLTDYELTGQHELMGRFIAALYHFGDFDPEDEQ
ncbi:tubulin-like doman-containing protein [Citromicrobium bathyomarinum]|uniref:tubulin-like doman-containing protein n=1 Tax=Citromicrobium TaxID=72173 RepID=UPI000225EA5B|nr:tubulin-like doman-containing protein [Citromicrobium sp. JLT1363]